MDDAATSPAAPVRRRLAVLAVLGAVALASLWPLAWAHRNGGVDALLGAGADSTPAP